MGLIKNNPQHILDIPLEMLVVLCIGLAFRVHSFVVSPVINPDGALYIQQARALWYGLKDQILACYSYLSIYPILIYLSHFLIRDWVVAAKAVSLFFGTLAMLPVFWLVRQFMDRGYAAFCVLAIAVNPTYVAGSSSVLRDPVYWFFASFGVLICVLSLRKERPEWMIISSVSMLLAAWARIEAVVYIVGSLVFLLACSHLRWKNLFYFALPLVLGAILGIGLLVLMGQTELRLLGLYRVLAKTTGAFFYYHKIRTQLKDMVQYWSHIPGGYPMMHFFMWTRNLVWLIALAAIIVQIKRGFFWPVFLFFLVGWPYLKSSVRKSREITYLLVLGGMGFIALYVQILSGWAMESRFVALILIPLLFVVGYGAEYLAQTIRANFKWGKAACLLLFSIFLVIPGTYKERKAGVDQDILLRHIGEFIAQREKGSQEVRIAGSLRRMQLIHFYANLPYRGAPCFDTSLWLKPHDTEALDKSVQQGLSYFVWDEKHWTKEEIEHIARQIRIKFKEMKSWQAPGFGEVRLFEVQRAGGK